MMARLVILVAAAALFVTLASCAGVPTTERSATGGSSAAAADGESEAPERIVLAPDVAARAGSRTTRAKAASAIDEIRAVGAQSNPVLCVIDPASSREDADE
jgi:hypothetical protein